MRGMSQKARIVRIGSAAIPIPRPSARVVNRLLLGLTRLLEARSGIRCTVEGRLDAVADQRNVAEILADLGHRLLESGPGILHLHTEGGEVHHETVDEHPEGCPRDDGEDGNHVVDNLAGAVTGVVRIELHVLMLPYDRRRGFALVPHFLCRECLQAGACCSRSPLDTLSVDDGVDAMIEFYADYRAQHADLDADGDVLELRIRRWPSKLRTDDDSETMALSRRRRSAGLRRRCQPSPDEDFVAGLDSTEVSSPTDLESVRAHLREEPLVKAQLPVHLRME